MNQKRKILFIITKSVWGGAQRYVYDIATNLPRDRFEAVVAAGSGDGRLFDMLKKAGVRTIPIPGLGRDIHIYNEWLAFRHMYQIIKKERPDVVHLNSSKAGALGAIAVFIFRSLQPTTHNLQPRIIFTAHGWAFHEDRSRLARAAIFFTSWFSSLFQDKIIVLDTADFKTAKKFIPRRKLALIPNGIREIDFYARPDMSGRAAARAFLSQKIGRSIADHTVLIGTIAELTNNKGLHHLIDGIRRIAHQQTTPHIRANKDLMGNSILACIIGDGEEKENLKKQIDELGLNDSVFLTGFIPDASRYLTALDIFVLPSLKEGLPYVVMEAMSAGLPVAATRIGGIPDIIADGQNGLLVKPKDAEDLAAAIARLIVSPDTRARLGAAARKTIETKFPFRAMMKRTIALYAPKRQ